jgi:hypothetical protein
VHTNSHCRKSFLYGGAVISLNNNNSTGGLALGLSVFSLICVTSIFLFKVRDLILISGLLAIVSGICAIVLASIFIVRSRRHKFKAIIIGIMAILFGLPGALSLLYIVYLVLIL